MPGLDDFVWINIQVKSYTLFDAGVKVVITSVLGAAAAVECLFFRSKAPQKRQV